jgi:lysophospholipase L1-like esterase
VIDRGPGWIPQERWEDHHLLDWNADAAHFSAERAEEGTDHPNEWEVRNGEATIQEEAFVLRTSRRAGVALAGALAGLVAQALIARRRTYLIDAAPGEIDERFGDGGKLIHLIVIGDSTSVGVGAGSRARSYPVLLARTLGRHLSVTLDVLGRSGVRMADVAAELAPQAASMRPDMVLIGVGVNDAIHLTPLPRVRAGLREALQVLADAGTTTVVALGPSLDAPALPRPLRDLVAARCRAINRTLRRTAEAAGIHVVDLGPTVDAFARDPDRYFSEDLLHPGPEGYALWARALEEPILRIARDVYVS